MLELNETTAGLRDLGAAEMALIEGTHRLQRNRHGRQLRRSGVLQGQLEGKSVTTGPVRDASKKREKLPRFPEASRTTKNLTSFVRAARHFRIPLWSD